MRVPRLLGFIALAVTLPLNASAAPDAAADERSMTLAMQGSYGAYPMRRDASGTAWQPDDTPRDGLEFMDDTWMRMVHGSAALVQDHQGGPRGDAKTFSEGDLMLMAQRGLGNGAWAVHAMISADPLMGKSGYPLLFGSGETADGRTPLVDRQHPHNLLMELSTSYSARLGDDASVFGYVGMPGEAALGPPAFMHRFSGADNPEAPISHHWFDSTHITFGVFTAGAVWRDMKIESSVFNGREPDQFRYRFEHGRLDSSSLRLSWNPDAHWSLQASAGHLISPEQLEPGGSVVRRTASAIYQARPARGLEWGTTLAWGENRRSNGVATTAAVVESALHVGNRYTVFGRAERLGNDELFPADSPLGGRIHTVAKLSLGGIDDFFQYAALRFGLGALASRYAHAADLDAAYGHPTSYMVFLRVKVER